MLIEISKTTIDVIYGPERKGDVRHSRASIEKIIEKLSYYPDIKFREGLGIVYDCIKIYSEN